VNFKHVNELIEMNGYTAEIGIIGGSGFYELFNLADKELIEIETDFGDVSIEIGYVSGKKVAFLARHGKGHAVPPHRVNYRANALAMFKLGVNYVIATNAVGSLREKIVPGSIVIPDQIIDFTKTRHYTFFDGSFSIKMRSGATKGGVVHTDVTEPYCEELRKKIIKAAEVAGYKIYTNGVYICTEGPRFETPAEIKFFRMIGGDLVGMTASPEVFLFKELEICYASICVVTNYAAGMQKRVTHEEVLDIFNKKKKDIAEIITKTIELI